MATQLKKSAQFDTRLKETRRERLETALYLRLKKSKVFEICLDVITKSSENRFETPKGKTLKRFFPNWEQKKNIFSTKNFKLYSLGKRRIVPKNVEGGHFGT